MTRQLVVSLAVAGAVLVTITVLMTLASMAAGARVDAAKKPDVMACTVPAHVEPSR